MLVWSAPWFSGMKSERRLTFWNLLNCVGYSSSPAASASVHSCTGAASGWSDAADGLANFRAAEEGKGNAKITLLTAAAAATGAVCLDGSPGAYYHVPGTGDGKNKWYVYHQGGGWCESMDDCLSRSKGGLGSSTKYPAEANIDGGYFSSDPKQNPLMGG